MTYHVALPVTEATGTQYFLVAADSPEEACAKVDAGECEFDYDDIEVQRVGKAFGAEPYKITPPL